MIRNFITLLLSCWLVGALAQPVFQMSNQTVSDCEGFLLDSEMGDVSSNYDHNENYTFSICIPGATAITLSFSSFCTEADFDYLRIFDGPDTLSRQIGPAYSGEPDPPTVTATSGCLTINFISDANVTCTGWVARWSTDFTIPQPPGMSVTLSDSCPTDTLLVTFNRPLPCDSLYADAFVISGPQIPAIARVIPVNCRNGQTTQVRLVLEEPLDFNGNYLLRFISRLNACGNAYVLPATAPFTVAGCPLNVVLSLLDTSACPGEPVRVLARASGGATGTYRYLWAPVVVTTDTLLITLVDSVTVTVTVNDSTGATATDSLRLGPLPPPGIAGGDRSICQSVGPFMLDAGGADGRWVGHGFDEEGEESGLYDPDLAGVLRDTVYFIPEDGCASSIIIDIIPLDEGSDDAACPGIDSFLVSGGLPVGGSWSGDFIDSTGWFKAPADTMGIFSVTYSHPNGCSGSKNIEIAPLVMPVLDSICQSAEAFDIPVQPFGGVWSGLGITDPNQGEFDPAEARVGSNKLIYRAEGCMDSITVQVKGVYAGTNFTACPAQEPFILPGNWTPKGGVWSGLGVADPVSGLYDPGLLPPGRVGDTLTYTVKGCSDARLAVVRKTEIRNRDTLRFCSDDPPVLLSEADFRFRPSRGIWRGAGIEETGDEEWSFYPTLAGAGRHALFFEANTCADSIIALVLPQPTIAETTVCDAALAFALKVDFPGGRWKGNGIINEVAGIFDPQSVGLGAFPIEYTSPNGCSVADTVFVVPFQEADMTVLPPNYCFKDTLVRLEGSPAGGTFTIDGRPDTIFNPARWGAGIHQLRYAVGEGACADEVTRVTNVGPPLTVTVPVAADTLCSGRTIALTARAGGGSSAGNYTFNWDNGLGFGQTHFVAPENSTLYIVTAEDGCSDPARDSVAIVVARPINYEMDLGPAVCYGDSTFARIIPDPGRKYGIVWATRPERTGAFISGLPGNYSVRITDMENGCFVEERIKLPGYPPIKANFGVSPNEDCLSTLQSRVQVLDFSVGGTTGAWDFGDGSTDEPYRFGEPLYHEYTDTGTFTITLRLSNEGGCTDAHQLDICIREDFRLFAPNAFSPNGDGLNEYFQLVGSGIAEVRWQVFNRFGALLYTAGNMEDRWSGIHNGRLVSPGVYTWVAQYRTRAGQTGIQKGTVMVVY